MADGDELTSAGMLRLAKGIVSDNPDYDGDEWYTPIEYLEAAREVMGGIDLDPASCEAAQQNVKAERIYTQGDDSLRDEIEWYGRVWLNPPYSTTLMKRFVAKLIAQYEAGNVTEAVILTNNTTDTAWFHDLFSRYPACFTRGRVQFWRPDSTAHGARQGQTLFYLGDNFVTFRNVFSEFGLVAVAV
jgi:phage N-6-adenine-methyltransferase